MKNIFCDFDPRWIDKFKKESLVLGGLFNNIIDIQHIGSTSIYGLRSKPIIDIAILVDSIEDKKYFIDKLLNLKYIYKKDLSSQERLFFRKGEPVEYHLSITEPKYSFWNRNILFRDYLLRHKKLALEYQKLKESNLRNCNKKDLKDLSLSDVYNYGKTDFVNKILKLAGYSDQLKK